MNEIKWNDIITVPLEGKFDVWAKRWIAKTDRFEYRRFVDCFHSSTYISGCPKDWRPVLWCTALPVPDGYKERVE